MEATSETPWWSRGVMQLGPVVLGFMALLGVLIGVVPSPLFRIQAIEAEVSQVRIEHKEMRTIMLEAEKEHTHLLRVICRNTAKSIAALQNCDD